MIVLIRSWGYTRGRALTGGVGVDECCAARLRELPPNRATEPATEAYPAASGSRGRASWRFGPLLPQNLLEKVGGEAPTFPVGFSGPFRPAKSTISGPEALLRNLKCQESSRGPRFPEAYRNGPGSLPEGPRRIPGDPPPPPGGPQRNLHLGFMGFRAMGVTKPPEFIWFGDVSGPDLYKCLRFRWALISQTAVALVRLCHRAEPEEAAKHVLHRTSDLA